MHPETTVFLDSLLARCAGLAQPAFLTLTAIHPDGQHHTPSRHIRIGNTDALHDALQRLAAANALGWGAYVAIGLRKRGLGRWRRGGNRDVLALPALYADIDHLPQRVLPRLRRFRPEPSCIVDTGGGVHAYWWLTAPTFDLVGAARILRCLSRVLDGDRLSCSQSLRLPGSTNSKPKRGNAPCRIMDLRERHYRIEDFAHLLGQGPAISQTRKQKGGNVNPRHGRLNPALIKAVTETLYRDYGGYNRPNSRWIAALCPLGHSHDRPGAHFSFNPDLALGHCFGRHGRLLLRDLCSAMGIDPRSYGGLYRRQRERPQSDF